MTKKRKQKLTIERYITSGGHKYMYVGVGGKVYCSQVYAGCNYTDMAKETSALVNGGDPQSSMAIYWTRKGSFRQIVDADIIQYKSKLISTIVATPEIGYSL